MKTAIVLMLVAVLVALSSAGVFMLRKRPSTQGEVNKHMARALALRVALSVALFLFILLSWYMGWVRPGGLPIGR
jgi:hypothetical protein